MRPMRYMVARIGSVLVLLGTGAAAHGEILHLAATLTGACAQTDSTVVGSGIFALDTDTGRSLMTSLTSHCRPGKSLPTFTVHWLTPARSKAVA